MRDEPAAEPKRRARKPSKGEAGEEFETEDEALAESAGAAEADTDTDDAGDDGEDA